MSKMCEILNKEFDKMPNNNKYAQKFKMDSFEFNALLKEHNEDEESEGKKVSNRNSP